MSSVPQDFAGEEGSMQDHQVLPRWFERSRRKCRQLMAAYGSSGTILYYFSYRFSRFVSHQQLRLESDLDIPRQIPDHSLLWDLRSLAQVSVFHRDSSRSVLGHPDTVDGGFRSLLHRFCSLCHWCGDADQFSGQHLLGLEASSREASGQHL